AIDFDSPFGDSEPQSRSAVSARACFVDTIEPVEDSRLKFDRDSWPRITDVDENCIARLCKPNFNSAAVGGVLYRVIHQVQESLAEYHTVTHPAWNSIAAELDGLILFLGEDTQLFSNLLSQCGQIHNVNGKFRVSCVSARKHQQAIDQK